MPDRQYIAKIQSPAGTTYYIKDEEAREAIAGTGVKFLGVTVTAITDGASTPTTITMKDSTTKTMSADTAGSLVIYDGDSGTDQGQEFIWTGTYWSKFGDLAAYGDLAGYDSVTSTPNHTATSATHSLATTAAGGVTTASTTNKTATVSTTTGTATYTPAGSVTLTTTTTTPTITSAAGTSTDKTFQAAGSVSLTTTSTTPTITRGTGSSSSYHAKDTTYTISHSTPSSGEDFTIPAVPTTVSVSARVGAEGADSASFDVATALHTGVTLSDAAGTSSDYTFSEGGTVSVTPSTSTVYLYTAQPTSTSIRYLTTPPGTGDRVTAINTANAGATAPTGTTITYTSYDATTETLSFSQMAYAASSTVTSLSTSTGTAQLGGTFGSKTVATGISSASYTPSRQYHKLTASLTGGSSNTIYLSGSLSGGTATKHKYSLSPSTAYYSLTNSSFALPTGATFTGDYYKLTVSSFALPTSASFSGTGVRLVTGNIAVPSSYTFTGTSSSVTGTITYDKTTSITNTYS